MTRIAVDTNVLVRLATGDSRAEYAASETLFAEYSIFVPLAVMLEVAWVPRSRYDYSSSQFVEFVRWLLSEPNIEVTETKLLRTALALHAGGFDLGIQIPVWDRGRSGAGVSVLKTGFSCGETHVRPQRGRAANVCLGWGSTAIAA